jgi:integrase
MYCDSTCRMRASGSRSRWASRQTKIRTLKISRRRVSFLQREEADRLIKVLPEHMKPIVRFALATGFCAGEILGVG